MFCPCCRENVAFSDEEMLHDAIHRCPKCSGQIPDELCLNARAWESCSALQHLLDEDGVSYGVEPGSNGRLSIALSENDGPSCSVSFDFEGNGNCTVLAKPVPSRVIDDEHIDGYLRRANALNRGLAIGRYAVASCEEGPAPCFELCVQMVSGHEGALYSYCKEHVWEALRNDAPSLFDAAYGGEDARHAVEIGHFLALLDRWNLRYELQGDALASDSLGMEVTPKLPDISFDVPKIEVLIFDDANRPSRMTCKLLKVPQNALVDAYCLANAANNRWEGVRFYVDEGHMVAQSTVPFTTEHDGELLFDALISLCDVVGDELPRMVDCVQGQALDQTSR